MFIENFNKQVLQAIFNKQVLQASCHARSQDFSKGGRAEVMKAKALTRKNCL